MRKAFLILPAAWTSLLLLGGPGLAADPIPPPALQDSATVHQVTTTKEGASHAFTDNTSSGADNAAIEAAGENEEVVEETYSPGIRDPLEPVNRAIFAFNDKAYFWVMKPLAQGYRTVVPETARMSVRNFFSNLTTPIRLVNNLLQGKIKDSGGELLRFTINSTIGIAGLFDVAKNDFHLEKRDEDLGRTLRVYGLGHGAYIVLPLLGPSSLRDTAGLVGDAFLDPVNYMDGLAVIAAVRVSRAENEVSLRIGEYEDMKKTSVDPYAALRDAYVQYRARKVEKPPPLSR